LEQIEENINNITELILQFQIIIEEDILNKKTLSLASDLFLKQFLDTHFKMFKVYNEQNTKTQMLHLHVLNSITRLYELENEMILQEHVDVLIPTCLVKYSSKSLELQTYKVMELLSTKYMNIPDLMMKILKHIQIDRQNFNTTKCI
jgi:hypothetical protein